MIVYGSRMYGRSERVDSWGACEHCGRYARQSNYYGRRFGHVYFIPLIPLGGRVRVLFECSKCNMGSHVPEADVPGLLRGIRDGMRPAVEAVRQGHDTFEDADGDTLHAGGQLAGAVAMLHAFGAGDDVDRVLNALPDDSQAYHLVEAADFQAGGHVPQAMEAYKRAVNANREDVVPLMLLGEFCSNTGKLPLARELYEKARELEPGSVGVVARLADVCEALKDWDAVSDCYETLFEMQPALADEKKLVKTYRKACKKSNRSPVPVG